MAKILNILTLVICLTMDRPLEASADVEITPFSTLREEKSIRTLTTERMDAEKTDGYVRSSIYYVTDQFTDEEMAKKLEDVAASDQNEGVTVLVGDNGDGKEAEKILIRKHRIIFSRISSADEIRMHNKYFKLKDLLFAGSPNATGNAFDYNVESLVMIKDPNLSKLYEDYYKTMVGELAEGALKAQVDAFNSSGSIIRVALAPYIPIMEFIQEEIKDAVELKISMFLISRASGATMKHDLIKSLVDLSNNGVNITIKYDHVMAITKRWMKRALEALTRLSKGKITLIPIKRALGCMHDKLILVRQSAEKGNKVIIGSAGFSQNVQDNNNYENMLSIKDNNAFEYFQTHFDALVTQEMTESA